MKPDLRKLARTLSQIENGGFQNILLLKELYKKKRGIPITGVTGLPGSGKSTLVDQLIERIRKEKKTVGVIAVDPSSPFSGGALLGDRIRMQRHTSDEGVFIRSMGSRGAHGGLSRAARYSALCLDAFGFDSIIIETVGVGQTELDIMGIATTTVVVLVPESGDVVQTLKAGLNEIADIFVVNKADREGAANLQALLKGLSISHGSIEKPVLLTQGHNGVGLDELWLEIKKHQKNLEGDLTQEADQERSRRSQFLEEALEWIREKGQERLCSEEKLKKIIDRVGKENLNPYEALEILLKEF